MPKARNISHSRELLPFRTPATSELAGLLERDGRDRLLHTTMIVNVITMYCIVATVIAGALAKAGAAILQCARLGSPGFSPF